MRLLEPMQGLKAGMGHYQFHLAAGIAMFFIN
jgi:hypothetical protein